jgi:acetolactate decarboxylase
MILRSSAVLAICLILAIYPLSAQGGEVLFQYSTIDALLAGAYEGQLTNGDLKKQGDLGVGAFNDMDGEMVVLEGRVYQVTADGKVAPAPDAGKTPFATVTRFTPAKAVAIPKAANLEEVTKLIDASLPTKNIFYAVKIEGRFSRVKARALARQKRPYPPLALVVEKQSVFNFTDVEGTLLGFRCPPFAKGVNVPGYHLHFLTKDRTRGGHVLDCSLENLTVQIDPTLKFTLVLPDNQDFYRLELDQDRSNELHKVEK